MSNPRYVFINIFEPDVKVANDPAELVKGHDAQLETAVTTLLNDLDAKK